MRLKKARIFLGLLAAALPLAIILAGCPGPDLDTNTEPDGPSAKPVIRTYPASEYYIQGADAAPLNVTATASDGGSISYQWYQNSENTADTAENKKIRDAVRAEYTPVYLARRFYLGEHGYDLCIRYGRRVSGQQ